MRISFAALLAWVLPTGVLAGGAGLWPTWDLAGRGGVLAQAWAGAIVLAAVLASASVVMHFATSGPASAAFAFLAAGLIRLGVCVGLALLARWAAGLPAGPLFVWIGVFYAAMFGAEATWLARALGRDAALVSLGRIQRPCKERWDRHRIR